MGTLDTSIVTVALPSIGRELAFSSAQLPWVLISYTLVCGALLLLGGRAGDLFGRRRLLLAGPALLALASLAGGLAAAPWMLVTARVVQGVGAAAFLPASLALVTSLFEDGPQRHRAVGMYSAMGSLGFATGIVVGGVLTQLLGWRWVMFVVVLIVLPMLLVLPRVLPESRAAGAPGLDVPGTISITVALAVLLYALSAAATNGWPLTLGLLTFAAALLATFLMIERRALAPLVPLWTFHVRPVAVANAATVLHATSLATIYVLMLYLQRVLGYAPLAASLIYLPLPIAGAVTAPLTGWLLNRRGGVWMTLILGIAATAAGGLLLAVTLAGGGLVVVIASGVVTASGRVIAMVALTVIATSGLGEERTGLASGLLNTSTQLGSALGVAVVSAVSAARGSARSQVQELWLEICRPGC